MSSRERVLELRAAGDQRFNRRYDWSEIQAYYDAGNSITACFSGRNKGAGAVPP
jgi:hypothetical protein